MKHTSISLALAAVLMAASPAPVLAQNLPGWEAVITDSDQARLRTWTEIRSLVQGPMTGNRDAVRGLDTLMRDFAVQTPDSALTGTWRCRLYRVDESGATGLVAVKRFGWQTCRITMDGRILKFAKTSGSQRTSGRLYAESPVSRLYLGTSAGQYGRNPALDEVAVLEATSAGPMRLIFPAPRGGIELEILELVRR